MDVNCYNEKGGRLMKTIKRNRSTIAAIVLFMFVLTLFPTVAGAATAATTMTLATTTSTQDSGLLDYLLPIFKKKYNIETKVVAVGTGQAIEIAKRGDCDVILVHSRKAEDEFVASGFGVNRKDVMHNEFLIVGPVSDPAKIKGMTNAVQAFKKIADSKSKFVSRGDKSGTHNKELTIWDKAGIKPQGGWYVEAGQGMGDTLMMGDQMNAYVLTDEATYLSWRTKIELKPVVQGDKILFNPYGVIAVNPAKYPDVNYKAATAFINFLTGPEGQRLIANFGKDKYGKGLFVPDAIPADQLVDKTSTVVKSPVYTVKVARASVRSGPGTKYKRVAVVKKGTKLNVTGKKGSWYQIKYNGNTRYIYSKLVTKR